MTVESICTTSKLKRSEQSIDSPDFTHMRWRRIVSSGCLVTGAGTSDGSGLGSFEKPIFRQSQVLGELVEPHSGWRATADAFNLFWGDKSSRAQRGDLPIHPSIDTISSSGILCDTSLFISALHTLLSIQNLPTSASAASHELAIIRLSIKRPAKKDKLGSREAQVFFGGSSLSSASKAYQSMVKTDLEARLVLRQMRS